MKSFQDFVDGLIKFLVGLAVLGLIIYGFAAISYSVGFPISH